LSVLHLVRPSLQARLVAELGAMVARLIPAQGPHRPDAPAWARTVPFCSTQCTGTDPAVQVAGAQHSRSAAAGTVGIAGEACRVTVSHALDHLMCSLQHLAHQLYAWVAAAAATAGGDSGITHPHGSPQALHVELCRQLALDQWTSPSSHPDSQSVLGLLHLRASRFTMPDASAAERQLLEATSPHHWIYGLPPQVGSQCCRSHGQAR
jgi:hypothetical protein